MTIVTIVTVKVQVVVIAKGVKSNMQYVARSLVFHWCIISTFKYESAIIV